MNSLRGDGVRCPVTPNRVGRSKLRFDALLSRCPALNNDWLGKTTEFAKFSLIAETLPRKEKLIPSKLFQHSENYRLLTKPICLTTPMGRDLGHELYGHVLTQPSTRTEPGFCMERLPSQRKPNGAPLSNPLPWHNHSTSRSNASHRFGKTSFPKGKPAPKCLGAGFPFSQKLSQRGELSAPFKSA